jgi:hypothetical protein
MLKLKYDEATFSAQSNDSFRAVNMAPCMSAASRNLPVAILQVTDRCSGVSLRALAIGLAHPDQDPDGKPNTRGDQKTAAPNMMENDDIDQTDRCHANGCPEI